MTDPTVQTEVATSRRLRPAAALLVLITVLAAGWVVAGAGVAVADPTSGPDTGPSLGARPATLPERAVWPLAGTPELVRGFDPPSAPWDAAHRGVDLDARVGQRVRSAADGVVSFAAELAGRGVVVVVHGAVRTTYEPVTASVRVGQRVSAGATIGVIEADSRSRAHCPAQAPDQSPTVAAGSSGCLHWGLRQGDTYLDPLLLLTEQPPEGGSVRLLAESAAADAAERAAVRAAARAAARAIAAAAGGLSGVVGTGPGGEHGFALPVGGPISSGFGQRLHPVLGVWKLHDGTDVAAPCGAPLRAPADGVVVAAYANPGYGNRLLIDHGTVDGRRVVTALNHASGYQVGVGAQVSQGQVVGQVGRTGYATGCHLHLMVWLDDVLVDPLTWF